MQIRPILLAFATSLALASCVSTPETYGHFEGSIKSEWLSGEQSRKMRLLQGISYTDPNGKEWDVPAGAEVDGASIPRVLWTVVGSPFVGNYRNASVVHDYYCETQAESWQDTHRMFYHASLANGTPLQQAKIMFVAVFAKGPRWDYGFSDPLAGVTDTEVEELMKWAGENDASLADLEQQVFSKAGH